MALVPVAAIARTERIPVLIRRCLAALAIVLWSVTALAAPGAPQPAAGLQDDPDALYAQAMRESIGAPLSADLGTVATVRLAKDLLIVPAATGARLLRANGRSVPPDFVGLVMDATGLEMAATVRYVPAGFIDANDMLGWTAADVLDSLRDAVEHENAARQKQGLLPREARRWISPPRYDAEQHLLTWAALVIGKSAPRESDGEIVDNGIAFGRDGYIQIAIPTSVEKAAEAGRLIDTFLRGVRFRPGHTYQDHQSGDRLAPGGLAGAMGIDRLHKAVSHRSIWSSDELVPLVGAGVALVGAVSLLIYVQRFLRRRSRRV